MKTSLLLLLIAGFSVPLANGASAPIGTNQVAHHDVVVNADRALMNWFHDQQRLVATDKLELAQAPRKIDQSEVFQTGLSLRKESNQTAKEEASSRSSGDLLAPAPRVISYPYEKALLPFSAHSGSGVCLGIRGEHSIDRYLPLRTAICEVPGGEFARVTLTFSFDVGGRK